MSRFPLKHQKERQRLSCGCALISLVVLLVWCAARGLLLPIGQ